MRRAILTVVVLTIVHGSPAMLALPKQDAAKPSVHAAETPTQFYIRYRKAVLNATAMDDVLAFWRTELVNEFKQTPPDQRADLGGVKRIYGMLRDVRVTGETVAATGATLSLAAIGPEQKQMTGTAYLVKENGQWKLFEQEEWN
jgi:hypothetical protein